jgi:hypothetical protein
MLNPKQYKTNQRNPSPSRNFAQDTKGSNSSQEYLSYTTVTAQNV